MYIAYSEGTTSYSYGSSKQAILKQSKPSANTKSMAFLSIKFALVAVVLAAIFSFGAIVHAYAGDGHAVQTSTVSANNDYKGTKFSSVQTSEQIVVTKGDTLWSIASSKVEQGQNIRSYLEELKKLNHLKSVSLREGQVLLLP